MDCTIEHNLGGFAVYEKNPEVRITSFSKGGDMTVAVLPVAEVFKGARFSLFTAWYEGEDQWDTDIHAGAQRLRINRTTAQIKAALKKCGFDKDVIRDTIQKAKGKKK